MQSTEGHMQNAGLLSLTEAAHSPVTIRYFTNISNACSRNDIVQGLHYRFHDAPFPIEWPITQPIFWLTHKLVMQMGPKLWLQLFFHLLRTGALSGSISQFRETDAADSCQKEIRCWVFYKANGKMAFVPSVWFFHYYPPVWRISRAFFFKTLADNSFSICSTINVTEDIVI